MHRCTAAFGSVSALAVLVFAGSAHAGYDSTSTDGEALSDDQKMAIDMAIDEIRDCGEDLGGDAETVYTFIADCLDKMLEDGRICVENDTGKGFAGIMTPGERGSNTRTGDCSKDKMNIRKDFISKDSPAFCQLQAILLHEGVHTVQGGEDFTNIARSEWMAHGIETGYLDKKIRNGAEGLGDFRDEAADLRDNYCRTVREEDRKKRARESGKSRERKVSAQTGVSYAPDRDQPGGIAISEGGFQFGQIQTPYDEIRDFHIAPDPLNPGADLLLVCGGGASAGCSAYSDMNRDGIPDEAGGQTFAGAAIVDPIAIDSFFDICYMLDLDSQRVLFAPLPEVPGDPIVAQLYFDAGGVLPPDQFFASLRISLPPLGPPLVALSTREFDTSFQLFGDQDFLLGEEDDDPATGPELAVFQPAQQGFGLFPSPPPLLPIKPFFGEQQIEAVVQPGVNQLFLADPITGTPLGSPIGATFGSGVSESVVLPLPTPVLPGEAFVVLNVDSGLFSGVAVACPPQPRIDDIIPLPPNPDLPLPVPPDAIFPGVPIEIVGLNLVGPGIEVTFNNTPANIIEMFPSPSGRDRLIVEVPPVDVYTTFGLTVVKVTNPAFTPSVSNCVGFTVSGDCNLNGVEDFYEIALGQVPDLDGNGVPDDCQDVPPCEGDANGDLMVTIADVLFIIARFGDPVPSPADVNGDNSVTIADVLFAIARFGSPCGGPL